MKERGGFALSRKAPRGNAQEHHARRSRQGHHLLCLVLALLGALCLKYYYSQADSEALGWILRPTAAGVQWLGLSVFTAEPGTGWVCFERGIVIAPACAGVNFLIMAFGMTAMTGLGWFEKECSKLLWLVVSAGIAYGLTIVTNTLRIVLSIWLYAADSGVGWLTPAHIHRLVGIALYLGALYAAYGMLCRLRRHLTKPIAALTSPVRTGGVPGTPLADLLPLSWYAAVALVIPLTTALWRRDGVFSWEHTAFVATVCIIVGASQFLLHKVNLNRPLPVWSAPRVKVATSRSEHAAQNSNCGGRAGYRRHHSIRP